MPEGKYFRVRSRMSGMVLDVYSGVCEPNQRVVMWSAKPEEYDNQLWRADPLTKTIRSKADEGYCLDIDGEGILIVNEFNADSDTQRWKVSGDRLQRWADPNLVLDIAERSEEEGARVIQFGFHGNDNQQWDFEHEQPVYFFLRSAMHGKVLDVYEACCDEGARVCCWDRKDTADDNQLWYEDRHGYLRSKLSNMVFDASGEDICLHTHDTGSDRQRWVLSEGKIVNVDRPEEAMDIKARCEDNGACVIPWSVHGGDNQIWEIDVV